MFQAINRLPGLVGNLLKTNPNQNGTSNMVSDNSGFATLAAFQPSQLFGFTVKLLDFPTEAAHLLYSLRVSNGSCTPLVQPACRLAPCRW